MTSAQLRAATKDLAETPVVFITRDGIVHEVSSAATEYGPLEGCEVNRRPVRLVLRELPHDPIPVLTDDELAPCREHPGVEYLAIEMLTNSRAYHVCKNLIRRGYQARKRKLAEDRHAVYATYPTPEGSNGE